MVDYNVISILIGPSALDPITSTVYHLGGGTRRTDMDGLPSPRATNLLVLICGRSLILGSGIHVFLSKKVSERVGDKTFINFWTLWAQNFLNVFLPLSLVNFDMSSLSLEFRLKWLKMERSVRDPQIFYYLSTFVIFWAHLCL